MTIMAHSNKTPKIASTAHLMDGARVIGDVTLGEKVGIWFNATLRADMAPITIGDETNIQDNAVVHTDENEPTTIGKGVTVGHSAIIHASTVEDGALIGMGSIILNGAVVESNALVAAGAVVTPGTRVESGTLVVGNPAKKIKTLSDKDLEGIRRNKDHYVSLLKSYHDET